MPVSSVDRTEDAFASFVDLSDYVYNPHTRMYRRSVDYVCSYDDRICIRVSLNVADAIHSFAKDCNMDISMPFLDNSIFHDLSIMSLSPISFHDCTWDQGEICECPCCNNIGQESDDIPKGAIRLYAGDNLDYSDKYNTYCQLHGDLHLPEIGRMGPPHKPIFYVCLGGMWFYSNQRKIVLNYVRGWAVAHHIGSDDIILEANSRSVHTFAPYRIGDKTLLDVPGIDNSCAFSAIMFYHYYSKYNQVLDCHLSVINRKYNRRTFMDSMKIHVAKFEGQMKDENRLYAGNQLPKLNKNGLTMREVEALAKLVDLEVMLAHSANDVSYLPNKNTLIVYQSHVYLHLPNFKDDYNHLLDEVRKANVINSDLDIVDSEEEDINDYMPAFEANNPLPVKKQLAVHSFVPAVKRDVKPTFQKWTSNFHNYYDINVNFKYGKYTEDLLRDKFYLIRQHPIEFKNRQAKSYSHPYLRTMCDALTVDLVNAIHTEWVLNPKLVVAEVGSKIHKMDDLMNGAIFNKSINYIAYRADIMPGYDSVYLREHAKYQPYITNKIVNHEVIDDADVAVFVESYHYDVKGYIAANLANRKANNKHYTVYVLQTLFNTDDGVYGAYDNEAIATVKNGMVSYQPRDNSKYEHSLMIHPNLDSSNFVVRFGEHCMAGMELKRVKVGPQISMALLKLVDTNHPPVAPCMDQSLSYVDIEYDEIRAIKDFRSISASYDVLVANKKRKVLRTVYDVVEKASKSTVMMAKFNTMSAAAQRMLNTEGHQVTVDVLEDIEECIYHISKQSSKSKANYASVNDNVYERFVKNTSVDNSSLKDRFVNIMADAVTRTVSKVVPEINGVLCNINKISLDSVGSEQIKSISKSFKNTIYNKFVGSYIQKYDKEVDNLPEQDRNKYVAANVAIDYVEAVSQISLDATLVTVASIANWWLNYKFGWGFLIGYGVTSLALNGFVMIRSSLALRQFKNISFSRTVNYEEALDYIKLARTNNRISGLIGIEIVRHVDDELLSIKATDLCVDTKRVQFADEAIQRKFESGQLTAADIPCACNVNKYKASMPDVIANGEDIVYNYYDGCPRNAVYAMLGRHLQKVPSADTKWFDRFDVWYYMILEPELLRRVNFVQLDIDPEDYFKSRKPKKAEKYKQACQRVLEEGRIVDDFTAFVKQKCPSDKPRIIMGPHVTATGWPLLFNWGIKKLLMAVFPEFICDMNAAEIGDYMTQDLLHVVKGGYNVSIDGQNHDAHQGPRILDVHNRIIRLLFAKVCNLMNIPESIRAELLRHMTNMDYTARYIFGDQQTFLLIEFLAKVCSGMGIHTTVGNTLWMLLRNLFIAFSAGFVVLQVYYDFISNRFRHADTNTCFTYVAGDDAIYKIIGEIKRLIEELMKAVCINNSKTIHGTGESIKEVVVLPFAYTEFLSMHSVRHLDGTFVFFRQLHKALIVKPRVKLLDKNEHLFATYMALSMWATNVPILSDYIKHIKKYLDDNQFSPSKKRLKAIEIFVESYDVQMSKTHGHLLETDIVCEMWEEVYGFPPFVSYDVVISDNIGGTVFDLLYNKIGSCASGSNLIQTNSHLYNMKSFRSYKNAVNAAKFNAEVRKVANQGVPKPPGQGTSRKARQRRANRQGAALAAVVPVAAPAVVAPMAPVAVMAPMRTKRDRVRNVRSNVYVPNNRQYNSKALDLVYFNENKAIKKSVHDLLVTHFFSNHGISRGLARGMEETAITTYKGSFDLAMGNLNSTSVMSMSITPSRIREADWFRIMLSSPTIGIQNPYATVTGTTTVSVPGPFATTDFSNGIWRVVSFTLKMIPSASIMTQAGSGFIGINFEPNDYQNGINWTREAIDNLAIGKPIENNVAQLVQWVPNSFETSLSPKGVSADPAARLACSAIQAYYQSPQSATNFRMEWTCGIEFIPNVLYRPVVNRMPPTAHPDSYYFIDEIVREKWDSLVITRYEDYRQMLDRMALSGTQGFNTTGHNTFSKHGPGGDINAGNGTQGTTDFDRNKSHTVKVDMPAVDETAEMNEDEDNYGPSLLQATKERFCGIMDAVTGYNCDDAYEVINANAKPIKQKLTKQALAAIAGMNVPGNNGLYIQG